MNSSQVVGRRQVLLGEDVPIIIQPDGIGAEDRHPIKLAVDLARAEGGLRQCRGIQQPGKIGRMSRQRRRAHIWSGVQRDDVWRLAGGERRVHPRHIGRTRHLGQLDVNVGIRLLEPRQDRDHAVLPLRMVVPQGQGDLVLRAGRRERAMAASDAAMTERRRYRFIPVSLSRLRKQWRFSWQARRSRSIRDSMPKLPGLASLARNIHCDILDIIEILQIKTLQSSVGTNCRRIQLFCNSRIAGKTAPAGPTRCARANSIASANANVMCFPHSPQSLPQHGPPAPPPAANSVRRGSPK